MTFPPRPPPRDPPSSASLSHAALHLPYPLSSRPRAPSAPSVHQQRRRTVDVRTRPTQSCIEDACVRGCVLMQARIRKSWKPRIPFALAAFGESVLRPARLTSNIGAVGAPSVCASLSVLRGQVVSLFPRLRLWPCRACECVFCFAAAVLSAAVTLRCPVSQVSIVHS